MINSFFQLNQKMLITVVRSELYRVDKALSEAIWLLLLVFSILMPIPWLATTTLFSGGVLLGAGELELSPFEFDGKLLVWLFCEEEETPEFWFWLWLLLMLFCWFCCWTRCANALLQSIWLADAEDWVWLENSGVVDWRAHAQNWKKFKKLTRNFVSLKITSEIFQPKNNSQLCVKLAPLACCYPW